MNVTSLFFFLRRKFFTFILTWNIIMLIITISGAGTYPRRYISAFALGNLLTAILVRNELFGRLLYLFVNKSFAKVCFGLPFSFELNFQYDLKWPPLKFRLACTSALQHLGGIHSGCATSGFLWLFFKVVVILKEHKKNLKSTLAMGILTFIIVSVTLVSAFPWIRNTHHKSVAVSYRFIFLIDFFQRVWETPPIYGMVREHSAQIVH